MRKVVFAMLSLSFLLGACKKDEFNLTSKTTPNTPSFQSGIVYNSTYNILEFSDWTHYDQVLESLATQLDDHDSLYFHDKQNWTEQQLDSFEMAINFDEFEPLQNFENSFSFSSARVLFEQSMDNWLNNFTLDTVNTPFKEFEYCDANELATLNENLAVVIGTSIFFYKQGELHEIENLDWTEYEDIFVNGNFEEPGSQMEDPCAWWKKKDFYEDIEFYSNGNAKRCVSGYVRFRRYPLRGSAKAHITHFSRKSSGGWKRSRNLMSVGLHSRIYDNNCSRIRNVWTGYKEKNRKSISRYDYKLFTIGTKASKNDPIIGYFKYDQKTFNASRFLNLTW